MASLFDLKQFLSDIFSSKSISSIISKEDRLSKSEEKIFKKIEDFENGEITVQELRTKNRSNIVRLQNALERVEARTESGLDESFSIERQTVKEWREYEKSLRNQIYDIKNIIELLKKIIDAERDEVLLDIRAPFAVVETYFDRLKKVLKHRALAKNEYSELQSLITEILSSYQNLIDTALKYVDNESKYFSQDISLNAYFRDRGKLKQQLNGKTQGLLGQIQNFEKTLSAMVSKKYPEFAEDFLNSLTYLKRHLKELVQFCIDRVQISNTITVEAISVQRKKFDELKSLKDSLDVLYAEFLKQQSVLAKRQSDHMKVQAEKRIEEFKGYRNALSSDTKKLDDFIVSIEDEDVRLLKKEANVISLKSRISDSSRRFAATVAVLASLSVLNPNQMAESATISSSTEMDNKFNMMSNVIGTKKTGELKPVLDSLPDSFFSMGPTARKTLLDSLVSRSDTIDKSLAKLEVENVGYLKNLFLQKQLSRDSTLSGVRQMSDAEYITEVQKAIMKNNPEFNTKQYVDSLINFHTPKILPSWITPSFVKGLISIESKYDLFAVSWAGARSLPQLMKGTFNAYANDLDYDTYVWYPQVSIVIALEHIKDVTRFLAANDPRWKTYDTNTKLATIAAVFNCGVGTYQDKYYRVENTKSETQGQFNKMMVYLDKSYKKT